MAALPGSSAMPRSQPTGIAQGRQQRVDRRLGCADLVALAPFANPGHPRSDADQVVRAADPARLDVATSVPRDDRVGQRRRGARETYRPPPLSSAVLPLTVQSVSDSVP